VLAANQAGASGTLASVWWLVLAYFILEIGEMCLSPVGLSAVTQLSVPRVASLMMGTWFLATAFSELLAHGSRWCRCCVAACTACSDPSRSDSSRDSMNHEERRTGRKPRPFSWERRQSRCITDRTSMQKRSRRSISAGKHRGLRRSHKSIAMTTCSQHT
jgi:hypothetical protein